MHRISVVLGMPVSGADAPEYIAHLQELAKSNGAASSQPPQQPGARVNLGGTQERNFANMVAGPAQQQQLDDLGR